MSEHEHFTIVIPLNQSAQKMAQNKQTELAVRQAVWSRGTEQLKLLLGEQCSGFYPAVSPYGIPMRLPFGVALGCVESEQFLMCYLYAREQQEKEIERRNKAIRSLGKRIGQFHPDGETTLTVTAFQSTDPRLQGQIELARRFFSDDITGAAALYYLGCGSNYISHEQEQQLLSGVSAYALCVAELQPMEA